MVYGLGGGRKLLERSFLPPYPHLSRTLKRGAVGFLTKCVRLLSD